MKKFLLILAAFILAVLGVGAYVHYDDLSAFFGKKEHEHNLLILEDVAPTCTEDGKKVYSCLDCGEEITETLPAGHTEEIVPGYAATCTETGLTDGTKCSVCDETLTAQEEIPVADHTEEIVPGYAATCTETGLTDGTKCSVCDETLTAQEELPALGHNVFDGACDKCAYMDLAALYPNGYDLVAVTTEDNISGRLLQVGKVGEDFAFSCTTYSGFTSVQGWIVNGVPGGAYIGDVFEYNGFYYVEIAPYMVVLLLEGTAYFVEPVVVDNLANWTLPASDGYTVNGNQLTFAGTNELVLATKDKYNSITLTFNVSETQDVRGAFQIGWGAQSTDASINALPFVQFNYDRAVLVLPDGTKYDTSWLTGTTWRLTIDAENSNVVLSVDGQVVYNVDASWWTQETWGLPGHLILRAESNCALTFELTEMNPTV